MLNLLFEEECNASMQLQFSFFFFFFGSQCELGVKKELREMLPIIVYTESFSVKDTQ